MNQDTRSYPRYMYHKDLTARSCKDEAARTAALREGFSDNYQHQEYPKVVYHSNDEPRKVANPDELAAALDEGWTLEYEHQLVPQTHTVPLTGEQVTLPPNKNGPKVPRSPAVKAEAGNAEGEADEAPKGKRKR